MQRERELTALNYRCIAGVDEAGRGPLAGPVVAAAVVLPLETELPLLAKLHDSKLLSPATRDELFAAITRDYPFGVGIIDAAMIDEINIRQASWRAMQDAVAALFSGKAVLPDFVLIDGLPYGDGPWPYEAIVKGDAKSLSIAAASVVAKVTRDRIMQRYAEQYSGYGFERHKGYGSAAHLKALQELGPCEIHRRSFAPVRRVIETWRESHGSSPGGN